MGGRGEGGGREYGVRLVRGPVVRLAPHSEKCGSQSELESAAERVRHQGGLVAADLFCGAGGLSLGLEHAGFRVLLGVDSDPEALETHAHLFGGQTAAWDLADPAVLDRVVRRLKAIEVDLIAGGPPCQPFSRAGKSWIRELVRRGQRNARDERRELWRSFLEITQRVRPRAVLMENVPEMALDRDMRIIRETIAGLEEAGYAVEAKLVDAWRYGVPQFRQRLIVIGLRDHGRFRWPEEVSHRVRLRDAISDLPKVEGGWRPEGGASGFTPYSGPQTRFQELMRRSVSSEMSDRIYDHITRPVRRDDAEAFALMDSETRYTQLPGRLKRYREDVHDDRYNRLDMDDLSRTITAHIAKDGYWYIHPEQHRTLTIREAARIQTFPDHVRFAGPPSTAFRQIGNAVPPRLAESLAGAIRQALGAGVRPSGRTTTDTSASLARWITERSDRRQVAIPWNDLAVPALARGRRPVVGLRWLALVAEILLDRVPVDAVVRDRIWPLLCENMATPLATLENAKLLRQIAHGVRRVDRGETLLALAACIGDRLEVLGSVDELTKLPGVTDALALVVARLVPTEAEDPIAVTVGLLRVASRFSGVGINKNNLRSWARIELARLVGIDSKVKRRTAKPLTSSLAQLALLELAERVCTVRPLCSQCPLRQHCASRAGFERPEAGQHAIAFG